MVDQQDQRIEENKIQFRLGSECDTLNVSSSEQNQGELRMPESGNKQKKEEDLLVKFGLIFDLRM